MNLVDKNLPLYLAGYMAVAVLGGIIFVKQRILSEEYRVILPTLNGHGEEYQLDYVSTEDSALEILDYIKANCGGNCLR